MLWLYLSRSPHFYSDWLWPYCAILDLLMTEIFANILWHLSCIYQKFKHSFRKSLTRLWEAVLGYYIHMVYLVRNYTTTKNEGKVVQKKSSKDEKRGLSSFNLVQIQVGRIMKQQAFFGRKTFLTSVCSNHVLSAETR